MKTESNKKNNKELIAKKLIAENENLKNDNEIIKSKEIVNKQDDELIINHDK